MIKEVYNKVKLKRTMYNYTADINRLNNKKQTHNLNIDETREAD